MSKTIKYFVIALSFLSLIITLIWLYDTRSLESGAAALGSLLALIGAFFIKTSTNSGNKIRMSQKVGNRSNANQAAGDINIH